MDIPPLYGCAFSAFDDKNGMIIDENGLSYTLHVEDEQIDLFPIIWADKDLGIRSDMRF